MRLAICVSFLVILIIHVNKANQSKAAANKAWINERIHILEPLTVDSLYCIQSKLHPLSYVQGLKLKNTTVTTKKIVTENVEAKVNPWKESKSESTIHVLDELENKYNDLILSMEIIPKDAAVLFKESEASLANSFNEIKSDIMKYYKEIEKSLSNDLDDESLFTNDNQIESIQDERFDESYQRINGVNGLVSEFDACYASYLEGRKKFEAHTCKLIVNLGLLAMKPIDSIEECKKINKIKTVLDLDDASDDVKETFNACISYDFGTYLENDLDAEKLALKTAFLENDEKFVTCLKETNAEASKEVKGHTIKFASAVVASSNRYLPPTNNI